MSQSRFSVVLMCGLLAGCVAPAETVDYHVSSQYVAVSEIVGTIKCAFAIALQREDPNYPRLKNNVAALEFEFKVVDGSSYGGSVGANKVEPFVFAVGAGTGSILPRFGASVIRSNTVITRINSRLGLRYKDTEVCDNVSPASRQSAGFETRLANLITQLDVQADYSPHGLVDKIVFESNFGVQRKRSAGLGIDFVFFSGDIDAAADRNDIQSLKITIQAPSKDVPYPEVDLVKAPPPPRPSRRAAVQSRVQTVAAKSDTTPSPSYLSVRSSPPDLSSILPSLARPKCRPKSGSLGCLENPPVDR